MDCELLRPQPSFFDSSLLILLNYKDNFDINIKNKNQLELKRALLVMKKAGKFFSDMVSKSKQMFNQPKNPLSPNVKAGK